MADASAADIYARAYNTDPQAAEFYEFTRTMQAYEDMISGETTLVLTTNSDLFRFLRGMEAVKAEDGAPPPVLGAKAVVEN